MNTVGHNNFFEILKNLLSSTQILNYKPNMYEAIVFDLDGTIIFNGSKNIINPIKNFIDFCSEKNIKIIIITARPGNKNTINKTKLFFENLHIKYDKFFFKNPEFKNVKEFKKNARIYVTENINFNILMSIGDNQWDMGEYAGLGILMNANENNISYKIIN